jgi:hypothetical protein
MRLKKKNFEVITHSFEVPIIEINEILGRQAEEKYHDMLRYDLEVKLLAELNEKNPDSDIQVVENRQYKNAIYISFEIKKEIK